MSKPIPKGKQVEGDMREALDSRFLNATVLQVALGKSGNDSLTVTVDRIEHHDVLVYENGQKAENAYLCYFKGSDKPLKLAKTNIVRMIAILGPIGAGWHGKKIILHIESEYRPDLKSKGPCVRVKNVDPETGKKPNAF